MQSNQVPLIVGCVFENNTSNFPFELEGAITYAGETFGNMSELIQPESIFILAVDVCQGTEYFSHETDNIQFLIGLQNAPGIPPLELSYSCADPSLNQWSWSVAPNNIRDCYIEQSDNISINLVYCNQFRLSFRFRAADSAIFGNPDPGGIAIVGTVSTISR